jgi:hypothetical protein
MVFFGFLVRFALNDFLGFDGSLLTIGLLALIGSLLFFGCLSLPGSLSDLGFLLFHDSLYAFGFLPTIGPLFSSCAYAPNTLLDTAPAPASPQAISKPGISL